MITSQENLRIKEARKLHDRKHRQQQQRLLIEGVRLIADARRSGIELELIFYDAESALGVGVQGLLHDLMDSGYECVPCSRAVFATLADTVTPQGIAAVTPLVQLSLPAEATLALVLDRVRDPGNAGALLRTAEAAGVEMVFFGPETIDPYNDKVVRAGMGAHFRLPLRICPDWNQIRSELPAAMILYLADGRAVTAYDTVDWRRPSGLIVGGEAEGVSTPAYRHAQPIAIPMLGSVESLNAAVAGGVILFEAARQRRREQGKVQ